jgi:hypothetical protein
MQSTKTPRPTNTHLAQGPDLARKEPRADLQTFHASTRVFIAILAGSTRMTCAVVSTAN